MTEDKPVAWEVEFGNGEVELWSVKDHSSEPAFGETVTALYSKSPSAVRAAAIAECMRVGRNLYKGDGGRLNSYDEGWNDGVEAAERACRTLSPAPSVSEEWVQQRVREGLAGMQYGNNNEDDACESAVLAALAALGVEVKP